MRKNKIITLNLIRLKGGGGSDIHCNREDEFSCDLVTENRTRKLVLDVLGSFSYHIWVFQSVTLVLREIHIELKIIYKAF